MAGYPRTNTHAAEKRKGEHNIGQPAPGLVLHFGLCTQVFFRGSRKLTESENILSREGSTGIIESGSRKTSLFQPPAPQITQESHKTHLTARPFLKQQACLQLACPNTETVPTGALSASLFSPEEAINWFIRDTESTLGIPQKCIWKPSAHGHFAEWEPGCPASF